MPDDDAQGDADDDGGELTTSLRREANNEQIFDKLRLEGGYKFLPGLERVPLPA